MRKVYETTKRRLGDKRDLTCLQCGCDFSAYPYKNRHNIITYKSFCCDGCKDKYASELSYKGKPEVAKSVYEKVCNGGTSRNLSKEAGVCRNRIRQFLEFYGYDYDEALRIRSERKAEKSNKSKKGQRKFWDMTDPKKRELADMFIAHRKKTGVFHGFTGGGINDSNYSNMSFTLRKEDKVFAEWCKNDLESRGIKNKAKGDKNKSAKFKTESHFSETVAVLLENAGFAVEREVRSGRMGSGRRCDLLATRGLFSYAIECKNTSRTNHLDCAFGQVLCMNHFLGATPVVCIPSDLPVDNDFKVVCKRYGVVVCNEESVLKAIF